MRNFEIHVLGIKYGIEFHNRHRDSLIQGENAQAGLDIATRIVTLTKDYPDGDLKTETVLVNDLAHELIHAYLFEMGYRKWQDEDLVELVAKLIEHILMDDEIDITGIVNLCLVSVD